MDTAGERECYSYNAHAHLGMGSKDTEQLNHFVKVTQEGFRQRLESNQTGSPSSGQTQKTLFSVFHPSPETAASW